MIETNSLVSTDWMANHLEDNNIGGGSCER